MRRTLCSLLFAVLMGLVSTSAEATPRAGDKAPDIDLPALRGGRVKLRELAGKVVVVDFWASWCEPCKRELPELEKLSRELAQKGVTVVAVNIDQERKNAAELAQKLGLTLPVALDPDGKVAEKYDPPKMPTSFVIDQRGVIRFVHAGYDGARDIARLRQELSGLQAAGAK